MGHFKRVNGLIFLMKFNKNDTNYYFYIFFIDKCIKPNVNYYTNGLVKKYIDQYA